MMKALRVELYQDHVCWRQETGYRFFQTYPLPTPSMVRGLVHRLMGVKHGSSQYIPLRISIQGQYDSIFVDMQRWDITTQERLGESGDIIMFWEELSNVNLLLHIAFKGDDNNEANLEKLKEAFIGNTVVLGRNEDIARIDSIDIVKLTPTDDEVNPRYQIYALKNQNNKGYPVFRLPFAYNIVGHQRIFEYVNVCLMTQNSPVDTDYCCKYGGKKSAVCFLELSDEVERDICQK